MSIPATPPPTVQHVEGTCPDERWEEYGSHCYYFEKDSLQVKQFLVGYRNLCFRAFPELLIYKVGNFVLLKKLKMSLIVKSINSI